MNEYVGIDVGAKSVVMCVRRAGRICLTEQFDQTPEGHQALQRRGKKKIQALCAVMRKYLTGVWACLKLGEPFDSSLLFSEEHLKNA